MVHPSQSPHAERALRATKIFVDHMVHEQNLPRTVLALQMLRAIRELVLLGPAVSEPARIAVAEGAGELLASLGHTLSYEKRAKLDLEVSELLGGRP